MAGNVRFMRPELLKLLPIYELIRDCLEQQVKARGEVYLPRPNASDLSTENTERYNAYLKRAVFYDVTSRTLNGVVGQVFTNDPEINLPELLKTVNEDANGSGVTLTQHSKETLQYTVSMGRCGLFVDYPRTSAPATRAQIIAGDIKPTINAYAPENIINWQTKKRGAKQVLSLVVLVEKYQHKLDEFEYEERVQYRVLKLNEQDQYVTEIHRDAEVAPPPGTAQTVPPKMELTHILTEDAMPLDASGNPFNEIPFTFIGAVNNDPSPDPAPLAALAELNVAHYRNSADYEESLFTVGQPTYVMSGLTEHWYTKVMKGQILVGSRSGIALPEHASAEILQVAPNTMAKEGMEHKERQMKAIGAKLIEDKSVQQTATEVNVTSQSETSILATAAKNVTAGYLLALQFAARFVGAPDTVGPDGAIQFELNTDFAINRMTPQERTQLVAEWTAGAITFSEMRRSLRDSGVATLDDKAAEEELAKDREQKAKDAAAAAGALAEATGKLNQDPNNPNNKQPPNNAAQ